MAESVLSQGAAYRSWRVTTQASYSPFGTRRSCRKVRSAVKRIRKRIRKEFENHDVVICMSDLCFCLYVCINLSICLSAHLPICLSICLYSILWTLYSILYRMYRRMGWDGMRWVGMQRRRRPSRLGKQPVFTAMFPSCLQQSTWRLRTSFIFLCTIPSYLHTIHIHTYSYIFIHIHTYSTHIHDSHSFIHSQLYSLLRFSRVRYPISYIYICSSISNAILLYRHKLDTTPKLVWIKYSTNITNLIRATVSPE